MFAAGPLNAWKQGQSGSGWRLLKTPRMTRGHGYSVVAFKDFSATRINFVAATPRAG